MTYLKWDETNIDAKDSLKATEMYESGYMFGRTAPGDMYQTRSLRIDLDRFEENSENRRILKKMEGIKISAKSLPITESDYDWQTGKFAKDFYDMKGGEGTFSANKVKELFTTEHNFNLLLTYSKVPQIPEAQPREFPRLSLGEILGHCICYANDDLLHYSYPFYHIDMSPKDMGMGQMLMAINFAKESGKRHIYLGSASKYKLQFEGLEWFDGKNWSADLEKLKQELQ